MSISETFSRNARIIFINRFFYPDHSATSQILSDLAFHLAAEGRTVHIVTSRQRYDDPEAALPAAEAIRHVNIHRVFTSHFGRSFLSGRALDYLSFYLTAVWRLWRLARPGDIVVAETDPPLLSVVVAPVVRLRRAKLVTWLQDLFPEVASALGIRLLQGRFGRTLKRLRDASLRFATVNVVLGERERAFLLRHGVPAERIAMIHNWSDDETIRPVPPDRNALRSAWGLDGKFVVAYSGNLGRAHDVETILAAAERLNHRPPDVLGRPAIPAGGKPGEASSSANSADVVFLFIGGGHRYEWLQQEVSRRGLTNVMFRPYQPRQRLVESLGLGDLHLISLLPEMEGLIVPSKFYGIAAAGRPMLFIGDAEGEIARLLASGQCGATVAPGDSAGLAGSILRLQSQPQMRFRWGINARRLLDERFTKAKALHSWSQLLEQQHPTPPMEDAVSGM